MFVYDIRFVYKCNNNNDNGPLIIIIIKFVLFFFVSHLKLIECSKYVQKISISEYLFRIIRSVFAKFLSNDSVRNEYLSNSVESTIGYILSTSGIDHHMIMTSRPQSQIHNEQPNRHYYRICVAFNVYTNYWNYFNNYVQFPMHTINFQRKWKKYAEKSDVTAVRMFNVHLLPCASEPSGLAVNCGFCLHRENET